MTTALPRSVKPAPGELLPGYLLRLAHRIGGAPLDLAHRCNLTSGTELSTRFLVRLTELEAQRIGTVCRLDPAEAHAFTLARQYPGYAPVGDVYLGRHQSHTTMANDGWVFTAFSRYCPDCLTDTAHLPGGPVWHSAWRLPHTFLCPRHDRLLAWRCPACQAPAFSNRYASNSRWRRVQLTPGPDQRLHPAQCRHRAGTARTPACGHRLDHETPTSPLPTPQMSRAHERLAAAAASRPDNLVESCGQPVASEVFLHDVRLIALVVSRTWPAASALLAPCGPAEGTGTLDSGARTDGWVARSHDAPPADPFAAAALFSTVVRLFDHPDAGTVLARLLALIPTASPGRPRLRRLILHCSPAVRAILSDEARIRRSASGPPELFPQPATYLSLLDPSSIPATLPERWAGPLDLLDAPPRAMRRDAAIRLVQMASGHPRTAAARHLGIGPKVLPSTTLLMRTWQKQPGNAEAYQSAPRHVAAIAIRNGS
ncbi:TniQ family protein [Streptomyces sp. NPDC059851]|uniref:TniQ family protein n=1 Tax=Streptomyces sp. NPDC059851 TaxID=3346971 RepID=UPI0036541A36